MSIHAALPLGEVCTIVGGGTPRRSNAAFFGGSIPWATPTDVTALESPFIAQTRETITHAGLRESSARLVPSGTVLMTSRATIGYTAVAAVPMATNQGFANLICGDQLLPEYLAFWLRRQRSRLIQLAGGTTFKELPKSTLKKVCIPIPPLSTQRRIVDILNRTTKIEILRRRAAERLREFVPALFVRMFGDPVTNPMGWHSEKLGSLGTVDRGRSRYRPRNAPHLYGGPHPFVQTGDIANSGGLVTQYSQTYSDAGLNQSRMWPSGTLCITIAANIAMTGILTFDSCFPDSIVGFRPGKAITVGYVQTTIDLMQKRLEEGAPRAAQRNINLGVLRDLSIPTPPLDLQRRFADIVDAARAYAYVGEISTSSAAGLTASLMSELLQNDLRPSPVPFRCGGAKSGDRLDAEDRLV